jgi:hypothetical protein
VHDKPYTEQPDSDGKPDSVLAEIWWENHLKRDKSIIQALFAGQFKSVMTCCKCGFSSARLVCRIFTGIYICVYICTYSEVLETLPRFRRFEPFNILTVPIATDPPESPLSLLPSRLSSATLATSPSPASESDKHAEGVEGGYPTDAREDQPIKRQIFRTITFLVVPRHYAAPAYDADPSTPKEGSKGYSAVRCRVRVSIDDTLEDITETIKVMLPIIVLTYPISYDI